MIDIVLYIVLAAVLIQDVLLFILFSGTTTVPVRKLSNLRVSILVAARNEEKTIESCLNALIAQNYDLNKVEILVGNDQSEDLTREIVTDKAARYSFVHCLDIPPAKGQARGKAHVLAYLAARAGGDIFLITDADTRPNRDWIRTMVSECQLRHMDMVNGVTDIPLHMAQDMEWIYAQGLLKVISDYFKPVTCVGNNMAISRKAYEATGGYETIPFSVTEDHALFEAAFSKGYRLKHLFSAESRAATQPVYRLWPFLMQRRRWMKGAVKLPFPVILMLILQSVYLAAAIWLISIDMIAGLIFLGARIILRMGVYLRLYYALGRRFNPLNVCWYEIYSGVLNILVLMAGLIPGRIRWKGRRF